MRDPSVMIMHPETGLMHPLSDVAEHVGVTHAVIYGRLERGAKAFQIWRPRGTRKNAFSAVPNVSIPDIIPVTQYEKIYY